MLKHAVDLINHNYYLLLLPTNAHTCIKTLNYIANAPMCIGASVPSSGRSDIAFTKVIEC